MCTIPIRALPFLYAPISKKGKKSMNYRKTLTELYDLYNSSPGGLDDAKANANIEKFGRNVIPEGKKKSTLRIFLEQFTDFLVIILIIAAIISAISGDIESVIVIVAVITMNAILGTVQTVKAEKSLEGLKNLSAPNAKVLRNGVPTLIPSAELAVGDVVIIEAGDKICADGRIIESASLQMNESALTGESVGVEKSACDITEERPLAERTNMVYSGSFVIYGRAKYVITETGAATEVGKIATLINTASERKTPLQISLDNFGKKLSVIILFICLLVFGMGIINIFRHGDTLNFDNIMDSFMFAVALAVAAIPEALTSIVTIVLSLGTRKMANENAIIRKLQAVEGLGSVSIICSDKTGTLTQNKMTVRQIFTEDEDLLIKAMVLCNDSECTDGKEIGDPTETALINYAAAKGFMANDLRSSFERVYEIPFDSDRKLMSTVNRIDGALTMFTKGAADIMINRMNITEETRQTIIDKVAEFSRQGLRVLCYGCKAFTGNAISVDDEDNLEFIGLTAMMDPPRLESAPAVAECKAAGIKPVMITGDHVVTAAAIAKEIGILENESEAVEGKVLDDLTDEQMVDFVADKSVYARVTPEHKIRIVRAWQTRGCSTAMTGDGVNDAPALKQADIGIAMGITGTEAAKDAASMVLTDDNFATIIKSVKNGRNIYANIKKAILFLLSGNMAAIIAVLFCSIAGFTLPFEPIHLLFINLLTDSLPAIALGLEPHSNNVMKQKPRSSSEGIMTKSFLLETALYGAIISVASIVGYIVGKDAMAGSTMAFAVLCISRLFHGFSCKSERPVLFSKRMFNNKVGLLAFAAGLLLICAVLFIPGLHNLFKVRALTGTQVIWVFALPVASFVMIQFTKIFRAGKE